MGTVYSVRATGAPAGTQTKLKADIVLRLEQINALMSVYLQDSQISRFNALKDTSQAFAVSIDFMNVLDISFLAHELTSGAFDPTVKPLLDVWGFGPVAVNAGNSWSPPKPEDVQRALEMTGMDKIILSGPGLPDPGGLVRKAEPCVQLDFGGVAKGYAADQIGALLRGYGINDFLVDIGGDILASGQSPAGLPWRVGVNRPVPDGAHDDLFMVLNVRDRAVVTSGDYRQYMIHEGRHYSHVLDPRTGRPVQNNVAGVTVMADSATFADALATGLMVLGAELGLVLVEDLADVEALFVLKDGDGGFSVRMSPGFADAGGLEND